MSALVTTADAGHVRTITLNRPEKKNALSQSLAWGVVEAIDAAAHDDNVWVVAITGSGDLPDKHPSNTQLKFVHGLLSRRCCGSTLDTHGPIFIQLFN